MRTICFFNSQNENELNDTFYWYNDMDQLFDIYNGATQIRSFQVV